MGGRLLGGRIIETEAYQGPEDLASHSARGRRTARTEVMYGEPGRIYVYLVYGLHNCLNFVTREVGVPHAVLVRALDPDPGVGRASGPGLVGRALAIDRSLNGLPAAPPHLFVVDDGWTPPAIRSGPRVGVAYAGEWSERPWRFRSG